jgi:hypothetical protein
MASINYESIFRLFLGSITDYNLASLEENDANDLMKEYLHKALGASYLRKVFSSIVLDDESNTISYVMAQPTDDESDSEFVTNAVAKWMIYEWVANQVNNTTLTHQIIFSSKEKSFYSQQAQLATNMSLKDRLYNEARNYVMDRGFIHNSYLGG